MIEKQIGLTLKDIMTQFKPREEIVTGEINGKPVEAMAVTYRDEVGRIVYVVPGFGKSAIEIPGAAQPRNRRIREE